MMGSPENELGRDNYYDQTPFRVVHQNGYWLGKYPVTQAQWQTVMNNNPSHNPSCMDCPVENVNWHLAIAFCEILNSQFQNSLPKGYFFSLPTEAQWEYACRADTHSTFYTGNDEEAVKKAAWYIANSANHSHRVGEKQANPWGFYDMLGNVSEWCYDEVDNYPSLDIVDWVATGTHYSPLRMIRGGCYRSTIEDGSLRCSGRIEVFARVPLPYIGFRLCLRSIYPNTIYQ